MARIYISSTSGDLEDHRKGVYRALRQLRHDVISMEDYVATGRRSLEQCLVDVASCEIYVGIFAWRYGFIPPGQTRAITELEYREAKRLGRKCLIFLLDDDNWPRKLSDRDVTSIEKLREELTLEHLISTFSNPDKLARLVVTAVTNELNPLPPLPAAPAMAGPALPGESVYLMCDRQRQKEDFELLYDGNAAARVLAFAIPGRKQDMPESLVNRFFAEIQSRAKGAAESAGRVHGIEWPVPRGEKMTDRQQYLLLNLKNSAYIQSVNSIPDQNDIARHFSNSLEKVHFLRYKIDLARWQKHGEAELLSWYLGFWQDVAALVDQVRVVLFFNLIIPEAGSWDFLRFSKKAGQVPADVPALFDRQHEKFGSRLLEPLNCVSTSDLEDWMQEHRLVLEHDRKQKCQELMKDAGPCPPMEVIQGRLMSFCNRLNRGRQEVTV